MGSGASANPSDPGARSRTAVQEGNVAVNTVVATKAFKKKLKERNIPVVIEENFEGYEELEKLYDTTPQSIKIKYLDKLNELNDQIIPAFDQMQDFDFVSKAVQFIRWSYSKTFGHHQIMGYHLAKIGYAKTLVYLYQQILRKEGVTSKTGVQESVNEVIMNNLRSTVWNYSDCSRPFCESLCDAGLLPLLFQDLKEETPANIKANYNRNGPVNVTINTMQNFAKAKSVKCRKEMRSLGGIEIIKPYTECEHEEIRALSIITVAYLVDEEQNEMLITDKSVFSFIVDLLTQAVQSHRHMARNLQSATELAAGLAALALNDKNKDLIVDAGALPALLEMLEKPLENEEVEAAANTIWRLAFTKENRDKINAEPRFKRCLQGYSNSSHAEIKRAANGALWELGREERRKKRQEHHQEKLHTETADTASGDNNQTDQSISTKPVKHVMISYNWSHQKVIIKIKERLRQAGYKVWLDIDDISGNTSAVQAMAEAVENCQVFLMSMSERYKQSSNCRSEAEYARELQVDIVPLLLQQDYRPDGWLGFIKGGKLYVDFSGKYSFDNKINELIKELGDRGRITAGKTQVSTEVAQVAGKSNPGQWDHDRVMGWLREKQLDSMPSLKTLTGTQIQFLEDLSRRAPEFFFTYLKNEMGLKKLDDLMKFSNAISEL